MTFLDVDPGKPIKHEELFCHITTGLIYKYDALQKKFLSRTFGGDPDSYSYLFTDQSFKASKIKKIILDSVYPEYKFADKLDEDEYYTINKTQSFQIRCNQFAYINTKAEMDVRVDSYNPIEGSYQVWMILADINSQTAFDDFSDDEKVPYNLWALFIEVK